MMRIAGLLTVWLVTMALLLAILAGLLFWEQQITTSLVTPEGGAVSFVVPRGAGINRVARDLEQAGLVDDGRPLILMARLSGQASRIRAGEYRIEPAMSLTDFLDDLVKGKVILHGVTIPEGVTFAEFRARVEAAEGLEQTLAELDDAALLTALDLDIDHPEGWFFPDTYLYQRGDSDRQLYLQAHRAMRRHLELAWESRDENLPLNDPYEALILASIVERETGVADERGKVAGVFVNRLNIGMRLQSDPTIIYGLGEDYRGTIYRSDIQRDTPYNTYTRAGLPPTPIALPGLASIQAVTRPTETNALYFVADAQGGHVFSRTLDEHNRAVRAYRRALAERGER